MPTKTFNVTKQMMATRHGPANPGDLHIPIGKWNPGTGLDWVSRALLYAPVSFSGMVEIVSAQLVVSMHTDAGFHASGNDAATVQARRKTADWSESSHGGSTSTDETWGGDGDHLVEQNLAAQQSGDSGSIGSGLADGTEEFIDITAIVRDWFDGSPNYGLVILNNDEADSGEGTEFYSRRASSGLRPYIEVTYNDNTAPSVPNAPSPTGDEVVSSSELSMSHDDPDAGDEATTAHFRLWTDDGATLINSSSNPDRVHGNGIDCSWNAWPMDSGKRYGWDGRTYDGDEWSNFTALQTFYYEPTQPAPTLSSPVGDSEIATLTPSLRGTHNLLGVSEQSHASLHVEEWDGSAWVRVWTSGGIADTGTGFAVNVPSGILDWGGEYRWRGRVRTILGTWSEWAEWETFTTQIAASPTDVQPSGTKIVADGTVTISFASAPGDTITDWTAELYDAAGTTLLDTFGPSTAGIAGDGLTVSLNTGALAPLNAGSDLMIRVQYTNQCAVGSPWSSLQPFSVNAVPSAPSIIFPAQGGVVTTLTPEFAWAFSDSDLDEWGDSQGAYTIEVRLPDDTLVASLTGTTETSRVYDGAALSWEADYKVRVSTEDQDGAASVFSSYVAFTTSQAPSLSAVQVNAADLDAEGEINNPTPTVEWTFTSPNGKAQVSYRVQIVRASDEGIIFDSGTIAGDDTSFEIPSGVPIVNGASYHFPVDATETDGLAAPTVSTVTYLVDFTPPAELAGVLTISDPATSKITVQWESPASDPDFDHIEVWRRVYGMTEWRVLAENIGEGVNSFDDSLAALNTTYEYAVVQVHDVGAGFVYGEFSPVTTALSGVPQWNIAVEGRDDLTMALEWAESVEDMVPVQQSVIEALGRPYKIVVEGQVLGSEGRIDVRIDGTEYEAVARIEAILRARRDRVLIKSPTGEVYPSKMGSITRRRLNHGAILVSFPYIQIEAA